MFPSLGSQDVHSSDLHLTMIDRGAAYKQMKPQQNSHSIKPHPQQDICGKQSATSVRGDRGTQHSKNTKSNTFLGMRWKVPCPGPQMVAASSVQSSRLYLQLGGARTFVLQPYGVAWGEMVGTKPRTFPLSHIISLFLLFILRHDLHKVSLSCSAWCELGIFQSQTPPRTGITDVHHHPDASFFYLPT